MHHYLQTARHQRNRRANIRKLHVMSENSQDQVDLGREQDEIPIDLRGVHFEDSITNAVACSDEEFLCCSLFFRGRVTHGGSLLHFTI